ncbi:FeoA family protein [Oceanithermus sp.]|jgi:Fe2+ transport system protein FeoA
MGYGRRNNKRKRRRGLGGGGRRLSELPENEPAVVGFLAMRGPLRKRLLALGVRPGAVVRVVRRAPLGDPMEIAVGDTLIAIRHAEADEVILEEPR